MIQNKINLFDQLKNLINKIKPDFWKFAHLAHLYADSGVRSSKLDWFNCEWIINLAYVPDFIINQRKDFPKTIKKDFMLNGDLTASPPNQDFFNMVLASYAQDRNATAKSWLGKELKKKNSTIYTLKKSIIKYPDYRKNYFIIISV